MTKNKMIRVAEKWVDDESGNPVRYVWVGISWHTNVRAAKRYYAQHHESQKVELGWSEHGSGMPFKPLYPRLAKS